MAYRPSILLFAAWLCVPVSAQTPTPQPERRTFAVSVLDKDGNAVHGLTAANFRGTYRGQPVKILSATEGSSPRSIVILVDMRPRYSGSEEAAEFSWAAAEDAARFLVGRHLVALVTFSESVHQWSGLTDRADKLLRGLQAAKENQYEGSSSLYGTVGRVSDGFSPPGFANTIFLITGGSETGSAALLERTERSLATSGVRVFAVHVSSMWMALFPRDGLVPAKRLQRLSTVSGGLVVYPKENNWGEVASQVQKLYPAIVDAYELEAEFPTALNKPREWNLEVVDGAGKPVKDLQVAYPRLLVPAEKKR